jgi:hypothetical protein
MRFGIGTESDVRITFSFGRKFHRSVWKIIELFDNPNPTGFSKTGCRTSPMIPLILPVALCACTPHWVGIL